MTLSTTRTVAYAFGSLAGAFGAVALLARRRGRSRAAGAAVALAAACGALSVASEERAQRAA